MFDTHHTHDLEFFSILSFFLFIHGLANLTFSSCIYIYLYIIFIGRIGIYM